MRNQRLLKLSIFCAVCFGISGIAIDVLAQGSPFGVGVAVPSSGFMGWIFAQQAGFYRALSSAVTASKANGTAAFGLAWLSFLYGVFHAAGPGHGKAVISSYLVADGATMTRGILLSAAAALAQAITAITLVGVAAIFLGATARAMGNTVRVLELIAYGGIAIFGLMLAWKKGRAFFAALRARSGDQGRRHYEHHHGEHEHGHHHPHGSDHHGHDHAHGPDPSELYG